VVVEQIEQRQNLDTIMTFKEVMGYLRVSRSTLYRLMWVGDITGHKVGTTWRFFAADVRSCIKERCVQRG